MKPAKFEYHAPSTLDEAIALLVRYGGDAKLLAGGQSLVPLLNFRLARPAALFETYLTTTLAADEVLTEVRLPAMPEGAGWAFEEFARRHGDFAIVGVAAALWRDGARVTARLATAGAAATPRRLRACEEILERDGLGDTAIAAAARRASELVEPDSDLHASADYRRHLVGVLTERALRRARDTARA